MIIYSYIKRTILSLPKQVVTVVDLGYLGIEKDYPDQLSLHHHPKGKETSKDYRGGRKRV